MAVYIQTRPHFRPVSPSPLRNPVAARHRGRIHCIDSIYCGPRRISSSHCTEGRSNKDYGKLRFFFFTFLHIFFHIFLNFNYYYRMTHLCKKNKKQMSLNYRFSLTNTLRKSFTTTRVKVKQKKKYTSLRLLISIGVRVLMNQWWRWKIYFGWLDFNKGSAIFSQTGFE